MWWWWAKLFNKQPFFSINLNPNKKNQVSETAEIIPIQIRGIPRFQNQILLYFVTRKAGETHNKQTSGLIFPFDEEHRWQNQG